MDEIEIMAPAGSFAALQAAIKGGAGSVYLGVGELNMRARAAMNFSVDDLPEAVRIAHEKGVKVYLTLNTVMFDGDLEYVRAICQKASEVGVDAIIACDIAVIECARSLGLEVHLSVQANITNIQAVRFYSKWADVVVLARELTLEQISHIHQQIVEQDIRGPKGGLIKLELFVHGALCMAFSGKCYLSLGLYNASANRGACLQACRRRYTVKDQEDDHELVLDNQYIMSPKDLCTIDFLDQIIESGVSVLKIEGRGKPAEYVYTVTSVYAEAAKNFDPSLVQEWKEQLRTVYNRGFWEGGYYLGKPLGEWSGQAGSKATKSKKYVGKVSNFFAKPLVGEVLVEDNPIQEGDSVIITGPTTGIVEAKVKGLKHHGENVVTFVVPEKIRRSDKLYLIEDRDVR